MLICTECGFITENMIEMDDHLDKCVNENDYEYEEEYPITGNVDLNKYGENCYPSEDGYHITDLYPWMPE